MNIGIVGSEAAKFTQQGKYQAILSIKRILSSADTVVSGHCHLGGIDIWAEEVADEIGAQKLIFPPKQFNWSNGYKPRNLKIAKHSDVIYCITVKRLPDNYVGMRFDGCYHCAKFDHPVPHIKSGGCWTVIQAHKLGKEIHWIVVENPE